MRNQCEVGAPPLKKAKFDFSAYQDISAEKSEIKAYSNLLLPQYELDMINNGQILTWWKNQKQDFPKIAQLARKYLAIPATSASSERVFSTSGRTLENRRNGLAPQNVDSLLFIHDNSK